MTAPTTAPTSAPGARSFTDGDGRTWNVRVGVYEKRMMKPLGFDVAKLVVDQTELAKILTDDELLVSCLYQVCEAQAIKSGVDPDTFAKGLFGDPLKAATETFARACFDFFQDADARAALHRLLDKAIQVGEAASKLAAAKVNRKLADVDVERDAATLIAKSGNAPASLE